ncbi:hypothetical protein MPTK1_3g21920 [Marchantia polymorpha subsp. ruderalis]|uniref:Uncharacterized protein n=1 Tax=Marchantia polymorpha subsp. ruderalis TaxID=1480154 RepID=A0AAF6B3E4_MARPO|nr:hypothetical protein Mp_3g21920 [Marchantia polymorpha subsp. ruderalis]
MWPRACQHRVGRGRAAWRGNIVCSAATIGCRLRLRCLGRAHILDLQLHVLLLLHLHDPVLPGHVHYHAVAHHGFLYQHHVYSRLLPPCRGPSCSRIASYTSIGAIPYPAGVRRTRCRC